MDDVAEGPRARLSVQDATGSGGLCLRLGGELDIASLPEVEPRLTGLLERAPQPLLLDLADLHFLDSSGIALLVRLANRFTPVSTRSATEPVRRVLEALGLASRFGLGGG